MYALRRWSVRHARGLNAFYRAFESVVCGLHPLWKRIGYARLERPVAATERAILGDLAGSVQDERRREDNANLVGMLRNIRPDVLQTLVDHCQRRDVVWALKFIGEDEGFAWAKRLEC